MKNLETWDFNFFKQEGASQHQRSKLISFSPDQTGGHKPDQTNFFLSSLCRRQHFFLFDFFLVYQLERGGLGSILIRNHPSWLFFIYFYLNKWYIHILFRFYSSFLFCIFFIWCWFNPVLVRSLCCPVLVRCLFLFRFAGLFRFQLSADSMTLTSSTSQIRFHDYSEHLKFVTSIVGFVLNIRPFYATNSDVVSLFADSSLLVFSEIDFVMILIDVFPLNLNKWILLFQ
jgi:hypothetical protein